MWFVWYDMIWPLLLNSSFQSYITYLEATVLVSSTMVPYCSSEKQTYLCLQMKTNIDEIKLAREYWIYELNVWIRLGFLYWIKDEGSRSISSIWENRKEQRESIFPFSEYCFYIIFHTLIWNLDEEIVLLHVDERILSRRGNNISNMTQTVGERRPPPSSSYPPILGLTPLV